MIMDKKLKVYLRSDYDHECDHVIRPDTVHFMTVYIRMVIHIENNLETFLLTVFLPILVEPL